IRQSPTSQVVAMRDFTNQIVGGKSWHLKTLAEKLPDWIQTPRSIALPFGVFEAVLDWEANRTVAYRHRELAGQINQNPEQTLAEIRQCLLDLQLPDSLKAD